MRRSLALSFLALLAVPGAATAAPATLSPEAVSVSAAGVSRIEVANPNSYVLRGRAIVSAGRRTIATRKVRLGKRSVSTIELRLGPKALDALRASGGRAKVTLKLLGRRGRTTAKRTLTVRVPQAGAQTPGTGTPPPSNRWVGRMGTDGEYDDLEFTVIGGQMQLTKPAMVSVLCLENGGSYRSALSFELYDVLGPWNLGADEKVEKRGIAVNQLVSSGERTITYKMSGITQEPGRVTGTIGMSFIDSRYDMFTNLITFINCSGTRSFEAVPAP